MKVLLFLVLAMQLIAGAVIVEQYYEILTLKAWESHAAPLLTWKQRHGVNVLVRDLNRIGR
jgi:hypothetical protein